VRTEGRGQRSEDRGQRSEGRNSRQPIAVSQKDGRQRTEVRGQGSEDRGQRSESSTTLSFLHAFSGNPEDVMFPR